MKKTTIILFFAVLTVCVASCEKDNIYKPGKKIAKIENVYTDENGQQVGITPYETWHWDGNLLKSITYHWLISDGEASTETFTYKNGHLANSSLNGSTTYYTFDGDKLTRIESVPNTSSTFDANQESQIYEFQYQGSTLSKIIHTYHIQYNDEKQMTVCPLRHFLSDDVCKIFEAHQQKTLTLAKNSSNKSGTTFIFEYNLTWEGNNISRIESKSYTESDTSTEVITMTYDDKPNPRRHLFNFGNVDYNFNYHMYSANNIVMLKRDIDNSDLYENYIYEYTYDEDNYPSECTITNDIHLFIDDFTKSKLRYTYEQ